MSAALGEWTRVERPALADGARPRTEVLWMRNVRNIPTAMSLAL